MVISPSRTLVGEAVLLTVAHQAAYDQLSAQADRPNSVRLPHQWEVSTLIGRPLPAHGSMSFQFKLLEPYRASALGEAGDVAVEA